MTQEERILRLDELRKEYKDPTNGRSQIAIKLEARALKVAIEQHKKETGKLI